MLRSDRLDLLLANFLAIHQDIEGTLLAFATVVGYDQGHGMVLFHRQVEGEPLRSAPGCAILHPNRLRILALEIKIRFRLHFAGLDKGHGGIFEFLLFFLFGGVCVGLLLPLQRREQVPIHAVSMTVQAVEWHKVDVLAPAHAVSAELARLVGNWLEPIGHGLIDREKHGHARLVRGGAWHGHPARVILRHCKDAIAQIAGQDQRAPHQCNAALVVGQWFKAERLGQDQGNRIAIVP